MKKKKYVYDFTRNSLSIISGLNLMTLYNSLQFTPFLDYIELIRFVNF